MDPVGVGGRRCLIVDDNERFLTVAQDHLTGDGMAVIGTATSQAEALRQAAGLRPDIVLVDINLGGESGFELTRRLAEIFPELHGRMVLMSTHDEDDFAELIEASPAVGFIRKSHLSARTIVTLVGADGRGAEGR
jgi:DNA-binding NarL/FixJ family response regulator